MWKFVIFLSKENLRNTLGKICQVSLLGVEAVPGPVVPRGRLGGEEPSIGAIDTVRPRHLIGLFNIY